MNIQTVAKFLFVILISLLGGIVCGTMAAPDLSPAFGWVQGCLVFAGTCYALLRPAQAVSLLKRVRDSMPFWEKK